MNLKPCPFCGEEAVIIENYGDYRPFEVFCGCGGRVAYYKTKEEAIEAWNRRANELDQPEPPRRRKHEKRAN